MPRVARPETATKKSNNRPKHARRLTPQECRDVKAYWSERVEMKTRERKEAGWEGQHSNTKVGHSYALPWHIAKTVTVNKSDRRNPGRGDGFTWNADSFICNSQIDDQDILREESEEDLNHTESENKQRLEPRPVSIAFADLIRTVKPKEVKVQEFEMVPTVSRVIVADDDASTSYSGWEDDLDYLEDEEWEQLESSDESSSDDRDTAPTLVQRTYAQVLLADT